MRNEREHRDVEQPRDRRREEDQATHLHDAQGIARSRCRDVAIDHPADDKGGHDAKRDGKLTPAGKVAAPQPLRHDLRHPTRPCRSAHRLTDVHDEHQPKEKRHAIFSSRPAESVNKNERQDDDRKPQQPVRIKAPEKNAFSLSRPLDHHRGGHGEQRRDERQCGEKAELKVRRPHRLGEERSGCPADAGRPDVAEDPSNRDARHRRTQRETAERWRSWLG